MDYTNNYPYNYEGYSTYKFSNENTEFSFRYPKNWIVKEMKRWSGDETQEGDPALGGVRIYLEADSEKPIIEIYSCVSHLFEFSHSLFEQSTPLIIDNEKTADIWMCTSAEDRSANRKWTKEGDWIYMGSESEKENETHIIMYATYRNTYEGASLFLEKDVFNKHKKEIYTIISSIRFYGDLN